MKNSNAAEAIKFIESKCHMYKGYRIVMEVWEGEFGTEIVLEIQSPDDIYRPNVTFNDINYAVFSAKSHIDMAIQ